MGRTQSFDRDTVVRAARAVFWRDGFENASIPDLERATALSRSSIYNAFGSKRGLFDATVQSYLDEVIRPRLRPLQQDPVAPDALATYLDGLSAAFLRADSLPAANGCLLINAAGSPIAHDPEVARTIADYRDELRRALGRGVDAAMPEATTAERGRIADTVTGLIVAAFALVRIDPDGAVRLIGTARDTLTATALPAVQQ